MDIGNFVALCKALDAEVTFNQPGPPDVPFMDPFSAADLRGAIQAGAPLLPRAYQQGYTDLLTGALPGLVTDIRAELQQANPGATPGQLAEAGTHFFEPFVGAAFAQSVGEVRPSLRRFLAVISDLYRSFLSKVQRAPADVPLVEQLPPLATFAHLPDDGPFTIPADDVLKVCGSKIGVVSLPSSYRDHPLLWAALAHETGGHDVLHADTNLLPELRTGVAGLLADRQFLGQLWGYWMDEAASDVYGLLNVGPAFAINLAAFFTTLVHQLNAEIPLGALGNRSFVDEQNQLDPHPTDILRLHLALGVIESLHGLGVTQRGMYVQAIQQLARQCANGATTVEFLKRNAAGQFQVIETFDLDDMAKAARRVGAFIADARLGALGGHSVQEIETWDDHDEGTAQAIGTQLLNGGSVAGLGDDAQQLAGATLALLQDPEAYAKVTASLMEALDESFARDPIFGPPQVHHMFFRPDVGLGARERITSDRAVPPPALEWFCQARPAAGRRPARRRAAAGATDGREGGGAGRRKRRSQRGGK